MKETEPIGIVCWKCRGWPGFASFKFEAPMTPADGALFCDRSYWSRGVVVVFPVASFIFDAVLEHKKMSIWPDI